MPDTIYSGRQIEIAFAPETVRGVYKAPVVLIPKVNVEFQPKSDSIIDDVARGVLEDADNSDLVSKMAEGALDSKILSESFGYPLYMITSQVNSSLVETGVYKHVFELLQNSLGKSFSGYTSDPVKPLYFPNCVGNSLQITAKLDDYIRYALGVMGKFPVEPVAYVADLDLVKGDLVTHSGTTYVVKSAQANFTTTDWATDSAKFDAITPAFTTEEHFTSKTITVKIADDDAGLDTALPLDLSDFNITLSKEIEQYKTLGYVDVRDFFIKNFKIEGSLKAIHGNSDLYDIFQAQVNKKMLIEIVNTDVLIGATSNPKLSIKLENFKFLDWKRTGSNDESVYQELTFKGFYDETAGKSVHIELTNVKADYTN